MKHRLMLIGFGTVGQGLTEILINKKNHLRDNYGFQYEIVAVSDKLKGSIADPSGLDGEKLLALVKEGRKLDEYPHGLKGMDALTTIHTVAADIMIEVSYTDVHTGEPATSHCRAAFARGMHVITTNKGPVALHYRDLKILSEKKKLMFGIEGTVMSGTPVLNTALESLAGCTINRIRGILNGTTNYILSQMEQGKPYQQVLTMAQQLGYAEADPSSDVEGWDALAKVIILCNVVMGENVTIDAAAREGITEISLEAIEQAKKEGARWKLIGEAISQNGQISAKVGLEKLPLSDPLANVMGTHNAITFDTDLLGPVTIIGPGAGKSETGFSIIADLLAINRFSAK